MKETRILLSFCLLVSIILSLTAEDETTAQQTTHSVVLETHWDEQEKGKFNLNLENRRSVTPEDGKIRRVGKYVDQRSEISQHTVKPAVLVPLLFPKNKKVTNGQTFKRWCRPSTSQWSRSRVLT